MNSWRIKSSRLWQRVISISREWPINSRNRAIQAEKIKHKSIISLAKDLIGTQSMIVPFKRSKRNIKDLVQWAMVIETQAL